MHKELLRAYNGLATRISSTLANDLSTAAWDDWERVLGDYFDDVNVQATSVLRSNLFERCVRPFEELLKRPGDLFAFVTWAAASENPSSRTRVDSRVSDKLDHLTRLARRRLRECEYSLLLVGFTVARYSGTDALQRGAEYVQYGRIVGPRESNELPVVFLGSRIHPQPPRGSS